MRSILLFTTFFLFVNSLLAQVPAGYYNSASGLSGSALKQELHDIITIGHSSVGYTPGVWNAFYTTDVYPSPNDSKIWDIYSSNSDSYTGTALYYFTIGTDQDDGSSVAEGVLYNREHSFPKSWFGGSETSIMGTDLNHVFATDKVVNNERGNYPFGEVSSPTYTSNGNGSKVGPNDVSGSGYTGTVFEPVEKYKGDLARAYFYMAVRYKDEMGGWVTSYGGSFDIDVVFDGSGEFQPWYYEMLLSWHEADPVSQKERDRNDAVYNIQGNANPFIDHPEYVCEIWGGCTVDPEPTNQATGLSASANGSAQIDLSWTDAATGTQAPDGYLIKASTTNSFTDPVDGTDPLTDSDLSDGTATVKVSHGTESYSFTGLSAETTYYFKMWSYTNSSINIDFKVDGTVPNGNVTTDVAPAIGIIAIQDFDGTTPAWSYTPNPATYTDGADDWAVLSTNSDPSGTDGDFWAMQDLNNPNGGGAFDHTLTFNAIDISSYNNVTVSFDYYTIGFDATDYIDYEIFKGSTGSEVGQGPVALDKNTNAWTNVSISIPDADNSVFIVISAFQDGGSDLAGIDNFKVEGESIVASPTLTLSTSSLTGFIYEIEQGPSAEQSFTVEGSDLTDDITLTLPTNYEISTVTGDSFSAENPITLTQSGGAVSSTTIYVRLKAGLSEGTYNSEDITVESTDATSQTVTCSGYVSNRPDWCNLQWPQSGSITEGGAYNVYARIWEDGVTNFGGQGADISCWIGYSTEDTDPSTWTTWVVASYNGDTDGTSNDEYVADIGTALSPGLYYYASRFTVDGTNYSYGGFNTGLGDGFWDGTDDVSGTLTVSFPDWCNLQFPASGSIDLGDAFNVFARIYEPGVTDAADQGAGVTAWIGYSTTDTDPSTWTDWVVASYNGDQGNNDEYMADLGAALSAGGTYYYASRFSVNSTDYAYGGYNAGGGGFWDEIDDVSGVLTVTAPTPSIIITEFAGKGNSGNYQDEYIEISNTGSSGADLTGWHLEYYNSSDIKEGDVTLSGTLAANDAWIIAARTSGYLTISPDFNGDFAMNSTGYAVLKDNTSAVIDEAGGSGDPFSDNINYELTDCSADNSVVANWTNHGTGDGTPGVYTCGPSNDSDSDVAAGAGAEPATIASTVDTEGEKVDVFDFTFTDAGSGDAVATILDELIITQGSANGVADWTDAIAGAYLSGTDLGADLAGTVAATTITFASDDMITIDDGTSETYTLKVYLNTDLSAISDNDVLEFALDYSDISADAAGSSFGSGAPESGDANCAIDIDATELQFVQQPDNTPIDVNMNPSPTVKACDENGNVDVDYATAIEITSTGTMTGDPVSGTLSNGVATFTVEHTVLGANLTLTASSVALTNAVSNTFDITELSYCTDLMISEYMEGNASNTAIELFNGTGVAVTLDGYKLYRKVNNLGDWVDPLALSGSLPHGDIYLIVDEDGTALIDSLNTNGVEIDLLVPNTIQVLKVSGNDPIALFYEDGLKTLNMVDVVGDGTNFQEVNLKRNANVFAPNTTFTISEWTEVSPFSFNDLGDTDNPLPVTWSDVSVKATNGSVLIEWSTQSEINNDYFQVEHSLNNSEFSVIGIVEGAGNSSVVQEYSYLHSGAVLGNNYYRIKQVDFDGNSDCSKVVTAKLDSETNSKLNIEYVFVSDQKHEMAVQYKKHAKLIIEIFDITGKLVLTQSEIMTEDYQRINFENFNSKEGMYIVSVKTNNNVVSEKFMVK